MTILQLTETTARDGFARPGIVWKISYSFGELTVRIRFPEQGVTAHIEPLNCNGVNDSEWRNRINLQDVAGGRGFNLVLTSENDDTDTFRQALLDIAERIRNPREEDCFTGN